MPIYEFSCDECGDRFEKLVPVDTKSWECPTCGAQRTRRVLSAPGAPMKLVKTRGEARKQEVKNAQLHAKTKARFKKTVGKIHEAKRRERQTRGPGPG